MNSPFQSPHIKTFHQTIRLVFDINSAKNGLINWRSLKRRIVCHFWNFMNWNFGKDGFFPAFSSLGLFVALVSRCLLMIRIPFTCQIGLIFFQTKVNSTTIFERGWNWRHVHFSCLQLVLKNIPSSKSTYFSLQVIQRQQQGQTARERPLGIFEPFFYEATGVYNILNCKETIGIVTYIKDCLKSPLSFKDTLIKTYALIWRFMRRSPLLYCRYSSLRIFQL